MKTIIKYIILLLFLTSGIEDLFCQPGRQPSVNITLTNCSYVTFADVKKTITLTHDSYYLYNYGGNQLTDNTQFNIGSYDLYYKEYIPHRDWTETKYSKEKSFNVVYPTVSCPSPALSYTVNVNSSSGYDNFRAFAEEKLKNSIPNACSITTDDGPWSVESNKSYSYTYKINSSSEVCTATFNVAKPLDCANLGSIEYSDDVDKSTVQSNLKAMEMTSLGSQVLDLQSLTLDDNEPDTYTADNSPYTVKYYLNGSTTACTATISVKEPSVPVTYCKKTGIYNVTYPTGYAAYYLSITPGSGDTPVWGKVPDENGKFAFKNPLGEGSTLHFGGKKTATSATKEFQLSLSTINISSGTLSIPDQNSDGSFTFTDPFDVTVTTDGVTTHEGSRKWYVFSATDFPKTKQPSSSDFPASPTKTVSESSYESDKTFITSIEGCGQWVAVVDEKECCVDTSLTFVPASFVINCPNYNLLVDNDEPVLLSLPTVTPESSVAWEVVNFKNGTSDVAYTLTSSGVSAVLPVGSSTITFKTTLCETDITKECPIFIVKKAQPCDK